MSIFPGGGSPPSPPPPPPPPPAPDLKKIRELEGKRIDKQKAEMNRRMRSGRKSTLSGRNSQGLGNSGSRSGAGSDDKLG